MSRRKKKKNIMSYAFYRVYFVVVALVLIGIAVGAVWLNGTLKDYESAQPVYVAEKVADLFENFDFENIYAVDTSAQEIAGGDKAFYVQRMNEVTEGKNVTWTEGFSPKDNEQNYNVMLDGDRFATFTLVPSGATTPKGNTLWALGSVTTHVVLGEVEEVVEEPEPVVVEYSITAPTECTVTVDGRELTEEDAVRTDIPAMAEGFLPKGIDPPTLTEYAYTGTDAVPEVVITDAEGNPQTPTRTSDTSWTCDLPENDALRERYGKSVLDIAERLAKFTSADLDQIYMLNNCVDESPAYKIIRNFDNIWATAHSSVAFRNVVTDQYYMHSPDCVTCHVGFDYVLHSSTGIDKVFSTSYHFCFVRYGDSAKLYNLTLN